MQGLNRLLVSYAPVKFSKVGHHPLPPTTASGTSAPFTNHRRTFAPPFIGIDSIMQGRNEQCSRYISWFGKHLQIQDRLAGGVCCRVFETTDIMSIGFT